MSSDPPEGKIRASILVAHLIMWNLCITCRNGIPIGDIGIGHGTNLPKAQTHSWLFLSKHRYSLTWCQTRARFTTQMQLIPHALHFPYFLYHPPNFLSFISSIPDGFQPLLNKNHMSAANNISENIQVQSNVYADWICSYPNMIFKPYRINWIIKLGENWV